MSGRRTVNVQTVKLKVTGEVTQNLTGKMGKVKPRGPRKKPHSTNMVQIVTPTAEPGWIMYVEHVTDKDTLDMLHESQVNMAWRDMMRWIQRQHS